MLSGNWQNQLYSSSALGGGLAGLLGGLFGNSGRPYQAAQNAYQHAFPQMQQYLQQAQNIQNPFYQAGTNALPQYQDWLKQMQDPTAFINKTMSSYQESPWAKYQQAEAMRAANNMGSASGLIGSTPLMQQAQQNASQISSQDMQNYLGNVMGVNTQYGAGLQNMIGGGQNAADMIAQLLGLQSQNANDYAQNMARFAYSQAAGKQQDQNNIFGGIGSLLTGGLAGLLGGLFG